MGVLDGRRVDADELYPPPPAPELDLEDPAQLAASQAWIAECDRIDFEQVADVPMSEMSLGGIDRVLDEVSEARIERALRDAVDTAASDASRMSLQMAMAELSVETVQDFFVMLDRPEFEVRGGWRPERRPCQARTRSRERRSSRTRTSSSSRDDGGGSDSDPPAPVGRRCIVCHSLTLPLGDGTRACGNAQCPGVRR